MAVTREELKDIFRKEVASEFSHIATDEKSINIEFSGNFNNRMEKLLRYQKKAYWNFTNTVSKRIAIAFVTILVLFTTACSVEKIREPIVDFIKEVHDGFIQYFFEGDTVKEITHEYTINAIPDGFTPTNVIKTDNTITTIYENDSGEIINFVQSVTNATTQVFDTENHDITQEVVNDATVEFYEHDELVTAIWTKDAYLFELTYYGADSKTELIEIILSIE